MAKLFLLVLVFISSTSLASAQNLRAGKIRNRRVTYSENLKQYPVPPIIFERGGLARTGDKDEIIEKIVYPAVNKSARPIAAVVIEFYPDNSSIGVTIIFHTVSPTGSGTFSSSIINRNRAGHFDADAYKVLFEDI